MEPLLATHPEPFLMVPMMPANPLNRHSTSQNPLIGFGKARMAMEPCCRSIYQTLLAIVALGIANPILTLFCRIFHHAPFDFEAKVAMEPFRAIYLTLFGMILMVPAKLDPNSYHRLIHRFQLTATTTLLQASHMNPLFLVVVTRMAKPVTPSSPTLQHRTIHFRKKIVVRGPLLASRRSAAGGR